MELTEEQKEIISSTGSIKINAVAGSGKTTTVIEYALSRPKKSRILYLAFNKSVKLEAAKKFSSRGLDNVQVETAHSLAYRHVVRGTDYNILPQGYKTHEIAELLGLEGNGEKHAEYIAANHINKFIAYFCNSDRLKVQDLNYLDVVNDAKARQFVTNHYKYIERQSRILLSKMDRGEIDITHDFYLKKFQLSNPQLKYDYILFDEGQDASPAMLDIFLKQKACKVIVGDTYQQIYGWRHAVNSLEKADFRNYNLSTSFRFSQDIANLAMEVLNWKNHLTEYNPVSIKGNGSSGKHKTSAIIARTNLGLLLKAIAFVTENIKVRNIYFEGNINSYTYADEGASLYDVLNLYNNKHHLIKDKLIKAMKDIHELEEYIEGTEDPQLGMMLEIVREYGNEIPDIIRSIKARHVDNDEKDKAEMVFSTVHRCKGMEYHTVHLVNDFITEEKIRKLIANKKEDINLSKLNEEINLLYVAITRTKNELHIPEDLLPGYLPGSSLIHISKSEPVPENEIMEFIPYKKTGYSKTRTNVAGKEKTYEVAKIRDSYKAAYKPWSQELDDELTARYCGGANINELAAYFGRTKGAVWSRIRRLELEELYG